MSRGQKSMIPLTIPRPSRGAEPSWRTEPEIDSDRQGYLAGRRAIPADIGRGVYPFKGIQLSRADVEWLLVTQQDPGETLAPQDGHERRPVGLDLRGANLRQANLRDLPLARLLAGRNWMAQFPPIEGCNLAGAHLEGCNLAGASLKGMPVPAEHLKHVRQWDKDALAPADLRGAFFDSTTMLEDAVLGEEEFGFVTAADLHWGGANLSLIDWEAVTILGDERRARQTGWLYNYRGAVRAYRQLATVLREQGLHEEALPFAYRAQQLQ